MPKSVKTIYALVYLCTLKCFIKFIPGVPRGRNMPLFIHSMFYVGADFVVLDICCRHFWNCTLAVHYWSIIKFWWCRSLEWARPWKCFIMSRSKLKENILFKLFLVIISLLLSWLQMSCSHDTISHVIPLGDFTLLYYVPK